MSMTLNSAASEVAKIIGGQNDTAVIALAKTAIKATVEDWNSAKPWNFLLKDTAAGFTVTGVSWTGTVTTINAPSTGAFDGVNKNITVSGGNVVANTTVSNYTRNTDGTIASITLSLATSATSTNVTLTFGGNIPILVDIDEYNLPTDFSSSYGVYLQTAKRQLKFIRYRDWNILITDHTAKRWVSAYTIYNPVSPQTQNFSTYRMKVFGVPGSTDTVFLQYYREMNADASTLDIPNSFLYKLIFYAQWILARMKDTEDSRLPVLEQTAKTALQAAISDDEDTISEEDDFRAVSQMDAWNGDRTVIWSNGEFTALPWGW